MKCNCNLSEKQKFLKAREKLETAAAALEAAVDVAMDAVTIKDLTDLVTAYDVAKVAYIRALHVAVEANKTAIEKARYTLVEAEARMLEAKVVADAATAVANRTWGTKVFGKCMDLQG